MRINDYFSKGYYINLDRRTDRREEFETEMEKYGLNAAAIVKAALKLKEKTEKTNSASFKLGDANDVLSALKAKMESQGY